MRLSRVDRPSMGRAGPTEWAARACRSSLRAGDKAGEGECSREEGSAEGRKGSRERAAESRGQRTTVSKGGLQQVQQEGVACAAGGYYRNI